MKKLFFLIYLVTGITKETCGQENKILLGATEFNFNDEKKQDKINPHLGILYFQKDKHGWKIFDDSTSQQKIYFNIIYKGKKLKSVQSKVDTPIVWGWYFPAYTFKAKIPNVGRKNYHFSGNGELKYRPLLFTTSFQFKRNNKLFYRPTKTTDSLIIYSFLKKTAADLNLGNLDTVSNIIRRVNKVLVISQEVFLVEADINLNMYCYKEKVPFDIDISYFMTSAQKVSIADRKETYNCYFLVNKNEVSYIDYGLKIVDNADLDNDGYDELIFRMDKYNYSAYLLIADKWQTFLTNNWSYH